jgi:DnaJ-class molecular chaperone
MATNPYKTLGVDQKASQDEIKAAYRALAKKFHPDLNPGNKATESQFKDISVAYDQIGTPENRARFDRGEVEAEAAKNSPRGRSGPYYHETQYEGGRYANQFSGIDEDILNSILAQMGRREKAEPQIELYQMEIDFKDAILGAEREIALPSGKKFRVKIPPGVENGAKLRFAGESEPTLPGQPPGDVYVQLHVRPSPVFKRVGKDLEIELPISLSDALLGAQVKVPTIDGSILMNVPANVKSGQKLRAKGKGVPDPKTSSRGDQIVALHINMPDKVDAEFRQAIEAWRNRQTQETV